ncbi:MAG: glycosyl hydrolase family 65 protein, partial [Candidatus Limnocylindrales bacterium]
MPSTDQRPLYPVDAWRIREVSYESAEAARNETIFSLANGHLGLRGNLEEDAGNVVHGTYVNGFYEETPIAYGELAYGYARNHQVLLNVADGKRIQLFVGAEPLDLATGTIEAYERSLDLRTGVLSRTVRWRAPGGTAVEVASRRLVSLARPSIAAIDLQVTVLEGTAPLRIVSRINARVRNQEVSDDPRVGAHLPEGALRTIHREASGTWGAVVQRTGNTRLAIVAAAEHVLHGDDAVRRTARTSSVAEEDGVTLTVDVALPPGGTFGLTKMLAYATSLDVPEESLVASARAALVEVRGVGFEGLVAEQLAVLDRFWSVSDVEIEGDGALQQGVRFNLFSLFQSAGRDGRTSLAAKGLTGEGYEGHYFWDTEIFALPFFAYTQPDIARSLLLYRCSMLGQARARATEMSQRGALYPWRTIGGAEASAYFPAGTAQYHINADIAYAIAGYVAATGDRSLLLEGGAEVVFETARLWADLGDYIPAQGGAFCINEVTGPDEYTALVNNNGYTNLMARAHLRYAARLAGELVLDTPAWTALATSIGLTEAEVAEWHRAADLMRIPRDPTFGVHAQDDSFLDRAPWDFTGTPPDHYPLLLHYHPLVIYRHQVLKQSDIVLAQVLLGSQFSTAEKKRNFDYYDPLTTGDSSLSPCIQSVAAAELGYDGPAYRYFLQTARMDLDDVNGNVSHGVHVAAMAGSWVSLVVGFGGLRDDDGRVAFSPRLPAAWTTLAFRLRLGDALLHVTMTRDTTTYALEAGDEREIHHFGRPLTVRAGSPVTIDMAPRLEAVVLDLDGVITDTAEHHFRAWQRLASEVSIPFDRELNERLKGVSRMESLQIILDNAGHAANLADRVRLAERKNAYFRELVE